MATKRQPPSTRKRRPPAESQVRRARAIELFADGLSTTAIAAELGIGRQAVWAMRDDDFEAELGKVLERRQTASESEKTRLGLAALDVLAGLMESRKVPAVVRRQAATDLADRAGLAAPKKLEVRVPKDLVSLTDEELDREIEREAEAVKTRREGAGGAPATGGA